MIASSPQSENEADSEPPPDEKSDQCSIRGRTILVINTGSLAFGKRFILERIKRLGLKIVMLHREKNWADPFVDYWIFADTYNHQECVDNIKKFLKKNPAIKIEGATTFWEDDIPLLARICEEFGYIGNSREVAINTRSKFDMQEVLRIKDRPFIPQRLLKQEKDIEEAIRSIGFPAVIKPRYGADSQYVVYVTNEKEARAAYQYVCENCTPSFDPIYTYNHSEFVYQKFIQGKEWSIECCIQNEEIHVIGINEKLGMNLPFFIEEGDYCPPRIDSEQEHTLVQETKAALKALGLQNSLAHLEIKLTKQGPKIIEVGSRMGGVYIYQNVKQVYGFDLVRAACEIALGISMTEKPKLPQKHVVAKFFMPKTSGMITLMKGFDILENHPYVIDSFVYKKPYNNIFVPPEGYETLGWVITGGNSAREAEYKMDQVMKSVQWDISVFPQPFSSPSSGSVFARPPVIAFH